MKNVWTNRTQCEFFLSDHGSVFVQKKVDLNLEQMFKHFLFLSSFKPKVLISMRSINFDFCDKNEVMARHRSITGITLKLMCVCVSPYIFNYEITLATNGKWFIIVFSSFSKSKQNDKHRMQFVDMILCICV